MKQPLYLQNVRLMSNKNLDGSNEQSTCCMCCIYCRDVIFIIAPVCDGFNNVKLIHTFLQSTTFFTIANTFNMTSWLHISVELYIFTNKSNNRDKTDMCKIIFDCKEAFYEESREVYNFCTQGAEVKQSHRPFRPF